MFTIYSFISDQFTTVEVATYYILYKLILPLNNSAEGMKYN